MAGENDGAENRLCRYSVGGGKGGDERQGREHHDGIGTC